MILQEEFRKSKYEDLLIGDIASRYGINLENIFDIDRRPEELLSIYISDQSDEMFFLLDGNKMEIRWKSTLCVIVGMIEFVCL